MSARASDGEVMGELFEHAPCGLLVTRTDGTITRINRTLCTWLGVAADELVLQRRLQDLLTMGCKIFHQTHWMPLLQLQGSVAEVQLELRHADGHIIAVLVNAVQHGEGEQLEHRLAIFIATDRRKYERELLLARKRAEELLASQQAAQEALAVAEARLRIALDSARLRVWSIETESREARYEPGVEELLGLPAGTPVSADDYRACMHPDDLEAEHAALLAALDPARHQSYASEHRLRGHDGVERVVSSSGRAFFDERGRLAGFSGVLQDVTGWRRAEALLREEEQAARQRAILAEQLVGIVSHDLRTPLNAVVLGANLLSSGEITPAQARTTGRILSAAHRANRLIADLLDFTQARLGGGLRASLREVDLHALIADCCEELRLAWPGRMLMHVSEGEGSGTADPDRLAQVVTNLVSNALTYGDPKHPITVRSTVAPSVLQLAVHNLGACIPADLLPHIFEPLRRGEQQVKLGSRSVGLGLYIVREIASAHGGTVTVTSTAEDGTTFTVTTPR